MNKATILVKKKLLFFMILFEIAISCLVIRVFFIESKEANFWQGKAYEQQTRDRLIAPNRGGIYDRNMKGIAKTETVASVSVIHAQIKNAEEISKVLSQKLEMDYENVLKKVKKRVALERIKIKVEKQLADEIRKMNLPGVVVDEDIKRVYPYSNLAAQVIGFVGKDNQGIVGLEAKYDSELKGTPGKIMTETDASGMELRNGQEFRKEPIQGNDLVLSLDITLQQYAEQTLEKAVLAKNAKRGAIILMNPQNGEIYAMANKPDFDLNKPFDLPSGSENLTDKEKNDMLNQRWRNFSINDTYEPGSSFKIITAAAGLEEKVVTPESQFNCSGAKVVAGRAIKCWRSPRSHGTENFVEGVQNSCNPVFMEIGERLGAEKFYKYMNLFGFKEKTGIDLPGEAVGIMHKLKNVGPVELATMSFGQSFQITPMQLMRAAAASVNGGTLITPHFATKIVDANGNLVKELKFENGKQKVISQSTSETLKWILESVVSKGTGNKTYIPGYRVGGKTATSEKLPRRSGKYIASFLTFAPAENPVVMALVLIDEPQGAYYGGQVAGPIMKELLENSLPYLNIKLKYNEEELQLPETAEVAVPNLIQLQTKDVVNELNKMKIKFEVNGEGNVIEKQFPLPNEKINAATKIILYTN